MSCTFRYGYYDLKNDTILSNVMNTTLETVWELSTARIPWGLRPIIPCITLNFPNVAPPTRGFNYVSVKTSLEMLLS